MLTDHLPAIGLYGSIEVALMVLINYLVAPDALKGRARTGFINNVASLPLAVFLAGSAALGVALGVAAYSCCGSASSALGTIMTRSHDLTAHPPILLSDERRTVPTS